MKILIQAIILFLNALLRNEADLNRLCWRNSRNVLMFDITIKK